MGGMTNKFTYINLKKTVLVGMFVLLGMMVKSQNEFITLWQTDIQGEHKSSFNQIILPILSGNCVVTWEDSLGNRVFPSINSYTYTFSTPGKYRAKIQPNPVFSFNFGFEVLGANDASKLISIENWGTNPWSTMKYAFYNCINLDITANDLPNLSQVESMMGMFQNCESLKGNSVFSEWKTENITSFNDTFNGAKRFNFSLGKWDIHKVVGMSRMLNGSGLDWINYEATLVGWANQENTPNNIILGSSGLKYSSNSASKARKTLINKNWTISGDSYQCDLLKYFLFVKFDSIDTSIDDDPSEKPDEGDKIDEKNDVKLMIQDNVITISNLTGNDTFYLWSITGILISSQKVVNNQVVFRVNHSGIYIINNSYLNQKFKLLIN